MLCVCVCLSRVWLEVEYWSVLENQLCQKYLYAIFLIAPLDRFYNPRFTDETLRPRVPYVVDCELESGFVLSVSKALLLKVFAYCSAYACLLLKQKQSTHDFHIEYLATLKLPGLHKDCV